jgi:hypothetical protein
MRKPFKTTIIYRGLEWNFTGSWIPYRPAKITADPSKSYPAEGGYFDDYEIAYAVDEEDFTDMLKDEIINGILGLAEQELKRDESA